MIHLDAVRLASDCDTKHLQHADSSVYKDYKYKKLGS